MGKKIFRQAQVERPVEPPHLIACLANNSAVWSAVAPKGSGVATTSQTIPDQEKSNTVKNKNRPPKATTGPVPGIRALHRGSNPDAETQGPDRTDVTHPGLRQAGCGAMILATASSAYTALPTGQGAWQTGPFATQVDRPTAHWWKAGQPTPRPPRGDASRSCTPGH